MISRAYENSIVPASLTRPYLILFYGDLCFPCLHIEPLWQKIAAELEPLGVGFATIHSQHESKLARKIGVQSLPYIASLVDGTLKQYKDNEISLSKMVDFLRRSLPSGLVTQVDDSNYYSFLSGWQDNRVRALFMNEDKVIRMRYLLIAYQFKDRVSFGQVDSRDSSVIRNRFNIDSKLDSMLIFNEDSNSPVATLSLSELKPQVMRDVIESHKFLLLPRLASQVSLKTY
jgi:DnaJ family protein C protein 16